MIFIQTYFLCLCLHFVLVLPKFVSHAIELVDQPGATSNLLTHNLAEFTHRLYNNWI